MYNTRITYKLFKEDNNLGTLVGRGHLKWEIDLKFTFVLHGYTVRLYNGLKLSLKGTLLLLFDEIFMLHIKVQVFCKCLKNLKKSPTCFDIRGKCQDKCKIFFKFCGLQTMMS